MTKRGRPKFVLTEELLNLACDYARRGLRIEQIQAALGLSRSNFYKQKREKKNFRDAIKKGRALGVAHVAGKLLDNIDNNNVTAQIFYLKTQGDWLEKQSVELNVKGDSTKNVETAINGIDKANEAGDPHAASKIYQEMVKSIPKASKIKPKKSNK